MTRSIASKACGLLLCASAIACGGDDDHPAADAAGLDAAAGGEVDIAVCAAGNGAFSAQIDNAYLPFEAGAVHVLEGLEGGTDMVRIRIEVLEQTAEVGGVTARVVESAEVVEGVPLEPQWEFYAQAADGTVCIVGEDEDADGAPEWQAGEGGYLAGVFMPGTPAVGQTFEMKHGPDAVERGEITFLGVPTTTPAGTFDDTLTVLEDGPSIKKYARGVGMIYDDGIELIEY